MNVDEIVEKLLQLQTLLLEVLPAAQALQGIGAKPQRTSKVVRKYSESDKARWRQLAACPDFYLHSKRSTSLLIARREGLPLAAADTIRRAI